MLGALFAALLAALLIFYAGKQFGKKRQSRKSADTARRYFKGLSYVLNDQPDRAIDLFVELIKVDDETVETHFALGNLYRQRGETERAIRIHQNIYNRPALPEAHRSHAQYELGLDYFYAGILDRAETIFSELLNDEFYRHSSFRHLLMLYQKTKEWDKAVSIAVEVEKDVPKDFIPALSHFYCELAEDKLAANAYEEALAHCLQALNVDASNVRANVIALKVSLANGDKPSAVKFSKAVLNQNASLFIEVLPYLKESLPDDEERREFLTDAIAAGAGAEAVLEIAQMIREKEGDQAAIHLLTSQLKLTPSVRELLVLVDLQLKSANDSNKESLTVLHDVLTRINNRVHRFKCHRCGFHGNQMYWRCPTCKTWNSVKPSPGIARDW